MKAETSFPEEEEEEEEEDICGLENERGCALR
jgi:hypothetical protein